MVFVKYKYEAVFRRLCRLSKPILEMNRFVLLNIWPNIPAFKYRLDFFSIHKTLKSDFFLS